ncbi:hypothetical protein D9M68_587010 [compost metagenome]
MADEAGADGVYGEQGCKGAGPESQQQSDAAEELDDCTDDGGYPRHGSIDRNQVFDEAIVVGHIGETEIPIEDQDQDPGQQNRGVFLVIEQVIAQVHRIPSRVMGWAVVHPARSCQAQFLGIDCIVCIWSAIEHIDDVAGRQHGHAGNRLP